MENPIHVQNLILLAVFVNKRDPCFDDLMFDGLGSKSRAQARNRRLQTAGGRREGWSVRSWCATCRSKQEAAYCMDSEIVVLRRDRWTRGAGSGRGFTGANGENGGETTGRG